MKSAQLLKKICSLGWLTIFIVMFFIPRSALAETCQLKASLTTVAGNEFPIDGTIRLNLIIDYSDNVAGSCTSSFHFSSYIYAQAYDSNSHFVGREKFEKQLAIDETKKQLNINVDYTPSKYTYNKVGYTVNFLAGVSDTNGNIIAQTADFDINLAAASNTTNNNPGGSTNTQTNTKPPAANVPDSVAVANVPDYDHSDLSLDPLIHADSVPAFLAALVKFMLLLIAGLSVIVILIGAFRMVMSQGKTEALTAGKRTITWAIIGLVVALLSYSIVAILQSVLGV
jgi:Type IV secretion system pilin